MSNISLIIICIFILSLFFSVLYWCINKQSGTLCLYSLFVYALFFSILCMLSFYLIGHVVFLTIAALGYPLIFVSGLYIARVFYIDMAAKRIFTIILIVLSLVTAGFAFLLYYWNILPYGALSAIFVLLSACIGYYLGYLIEIHAINFSTACFYLYEQFLKIILGLLPCVLIAVFIILFTPSLPTQMFGFFVIYSWISCIFPIIILKIQKYDYCNRR